MNIVFVVDVPGWAHDMKTENIGIALAHKHNILKMYQESIDLDVLEKADLVMIYYAAQIINTRVLEQWTLRNKSKTMIGVCAPAEFSNMSADRWAKLVRERSRGTFVNSMELFVNFEPHFDEIFCVPNGVDTTFFKPNGLPKPHNPLVVGWAGTSASRGAEFRGLHLLKEAVDLLEYPKLHLADASVKRRSWSEMVDYYNELDVYVCASEAEGTPNGCMEAASCGVPILTTRVGMMPEFIEDGFNGYFIYRDVEDVCWRLNELASYHDEREQMGKHARMVAEQWDWAIMAEGYADMFEEVGRALHN